MTSLRFPNMIQQAHVSTVDDFEATYQNLKLFLCSEKGEYQFDPFFGIRLKRYLFEQNNFILRDILIDEIFDQISIFLPQIAVRREDIMITSDRAKIYCSIKATNQRDFQLNTYNLVLYDSGE